MTAVGAKRPLTLFKGASVWRLFAEAPKACSCGASTADEAPCPLYRDGAPVAALVRFNRSDLSETVGHARIFLFRYQQRPNVQVGYRVGSLCTRIIVLFGFETNSPLQMPPSANVGLGGAAYSDCVSNLLVYLGAESAVSSENPLKSLRIRADFDSTIRRFESSRPSQPPSPTLSVSGLRNWLPRE